MRTEARVVFDATAIYVGVRAFDSDPSRIIGFLTRRDGESSSDRVHVLIDSYDDRRTAHEFGVNPVGVKQDSYWFNDSNQDDSWDAVWDVVSKRDVARLNETATWPLLSKNASGWCRLSAT